jgi:hypothetical protein
MHLLDSKCQWHGVVDIANQSSRAFVAKRDVNQLTHLGIRTSCCAPSTSSPDTFYDKLAVETNGFQILLIVLSAHFLDRLKNRGFKPYFVDQLYRLMLSLQRRPHRPLCPGHSTHLLIVLGTRIIALAIIHGSGKRSFRRADLGRLLMNRRPACVFHRSLRSLETLCSEARFAPVSPSLVCQNAMIVISYSSPLLCSGISLPCCALASTLFCWHVARHWSLVMGHVGLGSSAFER